MEISLLFNAAADTTPTLAHVRGAIGFSRIEPADELQL